MVCQKLQNKVRTSQSNMHRHRMVAPQSKIYRHKRYRRLLKHLSILVFITLVFSFGSQLYSLSSRVFQVSISQKYQWFGQKGTARPDSCYNCFKSDFKVLISPRRPFLSRVSVLITVYSKAESKLRRLAIRNTWGSSCYKPESYMKCLFVFGDTRNETENIALLQEHYDYNDILQFDFIDTYRNLTLKLMSEFKWISTKCPDLSYVVKVDEDMYINTDLIPVLLHAAPSENFIGGKCWGPDPPRRDNQSKWRVSFEEYPNSLYPSMCSGVGYIISVDLVHKTVEVSKDIPFFWIDDVYLGFCLKHLKVCPVYLKGFHFHFVDFEPCLYRNDIITSHGLTTEDLYKVWRESRKCELKSVKPSDVYFKLPLTALH